MIGWLFSYYYITKYRRQMVISEILLKNMKSRVRSMLPNMLKFRKTRDKNATLFLLEKKTVEIPELLSKI